MTNRLRASPNVSKPAILLKCRLSLPRVGQRRAEARLAHGGRLQDHLAGGPFPFSPGTMTMPIPLPRSSISPVCRQHGLPVTGRVPMLRGCSSSLRQKPPRSVPPSSSAASWRQRSSCADCSLASPTRCRRGNALGPSRDGSRCLRCRPGDTTACRQEPLKRLYGPVAPARTSSSRPPASSARRPACRYRSSYCESLLCAAHARLARISRM